jgi:cob(I)alamin adenosyltransferase
MAFKIYTKTGDAGQTSLIGGTRVPKNHIRIECYGTVDELNSWMGLLGDVITNSNTQQVIKEVQDRLFTIGSLLATEKETKMQLPDLHTTDITLLENEIDKMDAALPAMKSFILPGGHPTVSQIHIVRCVCRRAERLAVALGIQEDETGALIIKYLNRLSDYLFMLARYTAQELGAAEIPWKPRM